MSLKDIYHKIVNYKDFSKNVVLNGVSLLIYYSFLQLYFFPAISKNFPEKFFGEFVVFWGILNLLTAVFANSLGIVLYRLNNKEASFKSYEKVINCFAVLLSVVSAVIVIIILILLKVSMVFKNIISIFIFAFMYTLRNYSFSLLRIRLKYKTQLISYAILTAGIVILFLITKKVFISLIAGESLTLIFVICNGVFKIDTRLTKFRTLSPVVKDWTYLALSAAALNLSNYLDRFILQAILNSELVAFFFVSSTSGRIMAFAFSIITNVITTYVANDRLDVLLFKKIQRRFTLISLIIANYVILNTIAVIFIKYFYGTYYSIDILKVSMIVNIGFAFRMLENLYRAFLLIKARSRAIFTMDLYFLVALVGLSFILTKIYGVYGYAISFSIFALSKLIYTIKLTNDVTKGS